MELNINSLSDFVKNAEILFNKGYDSIYPVIRNSGLFKEINIPGGTGNTREFSEVNLEQYAKIKHESDQASRAKIQQGYSKVGTLYRIGEDIGISYEMRRNGKYTDMINYLTNLGEMGPARMELDLTHRLTFGTATSYVSLEGETIDTTVGDTFQLFYTYHTLKASSGTFRNRLANNPLLSRGALEAMEVMRVENTLNQFGEKMTIDADILWCSDDPNTINTANILLKSSSNPDQNNPGVINSYGGKYRLVVLPRLATTATGAVDSTKAKYWGLASSKMSQAYLGVCDEPYMKTPPADGKSNEEFSTDDWNFGVRGQWLIMIVTAGWISASTGDVVA